MQWWQILLYFVVLALGWFLSYFVRPWVIEKLALRRELLTDYLIPFKTWCRSLHRELTEFKERYTDQQVYQTLSKTLIIIDYRELHDVLREAGQYRGKIEKDNADAATYLKGLECLVDNLWHSLQDDFSVNFDQCKHDVWMAAIINYSEKGNLVDAIIRGSPEILDYLKKHKEFESLANYLTDQVPKW